jgi:hypothetical protein
MSKSFKDVSCCAYRPCSQKELTNTGFTSSSASGTGRELWYCSETCCHAAKASVGKGGYLPDNGRGLLKQFFPYTATFQAGFYEDAKEANRVPVGSE